jgi:hypothetical protein
MPNFNYIVLSCQFCETPEKRVIWREGKAVTCFSCKMMRRAELAKLKLRSARRGAETRVRVEAEAIGDARASAELAGT